MKRKLYGVALCVLALSLLAGCGSGGGDTLEIDPSTEKPTDPPPSTTPPPADSPLGGSLGALTDIGDRYGSVGDEWYDTETIDINDDGLILASSIEIPVIWDPAYPEIMTFVEGHSGFSTYDDYYGVTNTSENYFETTEVLEITNSGKVIGNSFTEAGESESRAYLYDYTTGNLTDLAAPNYIDKSSEKRVIKEYSRVADINDIGEIILTGEDKEGKWAFYWDGQTYDTISDLEGVEPFSVPRLRKLPKIQGATSAEAVAINDNGEAIVNSGDTALYVDIDTGAAASLNYLSGGTTTAVDINNATPVGHVIGNSGDEGFFWESGVMYPISNPSGEKVEVVDMNNKDQVVGNSGGQAFLWHLDPVTKKGVFRSLGTLGGATSTAVAINDEGMVIGSSTTGAQYSEGNITAAVAHGFLWADGVMYDLGAHAPPAPEYPFDPDFYFSKATAISETGILCGDSHSINTHHRGFTLTLPDPLP